MENINWDTIGHILITLLIVSVFFETALSAIFNWSLFEKYLIGKGVKAPVSIALSFTVFWGYELDFLSQLLTALGDEQPITDGGKAVTALLVSGGSGGINSLFEKFNIRNPLKADVKKQVKSQPD